MESLIHKGVEKKNLEQILALILDESAGRNPLHKRRIQLLRDFFFQLEQIMSLIEFEKLTKETLITHLFLEQADFFFF